MTLKHLALDAIVVTKNVRTEPEDDLAGLMESIGKHDVLQPVLVVPHGDGRYELVAGHRRYAACRARNESTIPAIIRDDVTPAEVPFLRLVENVQRKDMSPGEVAAALDALKKTKPGISAAQLGKLIGKSDAWVYGQYLAARTYEELVASGMSREELNALSRTDLADLGRVRGRADRLEAARSFGKDGKAAIRAKRRVTKRGDRIDRSGGFAILGAEGSMTIRVMCETRDAQREVLACLLRLKTRRVSGNGRA